MAWRLGRARCNRSREAQGHVTARAYPQKPAQGGRAVFLCGMKPTPNQCVLTEAEQRELDRRAHWLTAPHREVVGAKVVLGLPLHLGQAVPGVLAWIGLGWSVPGRRRLAVEPTRVLR